ncbi:Uncharacterised protein [Shigella sonnei]|uniref:hypothetical protein n=1 Tax=Shigella sonnei TaxID=624 RepID=UPI000662CC42|nr:hypothetical protein [Shigella sonnei]CSI58772.1 Uncharacterised protein [Shigella sonnei]
MTGWELRIWRKSMLWSREKAAREFGVRQISSGDWKMNWGKRQGMCERDSQPG